VEGHAVCYTNNQQRPMGAAFGYFDVGAVVYGEKDVGRSLEVWEDLFQFSGIVMGFQEKDHGGPEEDYSVARVFDEFLPFQVSR